VRVTRTTIAKQRRAQEVRVSEKDEFFFFFFFLHNLPVLFSSGISRAFLISRFSHFVFAILLFFLSRRRRASNMQLLFLAIMLLLFSIGRGARYTQSFNTTTVSNGTTMAMLSDGARVDGSAVVANGELVLTVIGVMSQVGRFFIPPVANSSLGWTATFTLKLNSSWLPADGVGLVWGNTDAFVEPIVVQGNMGGNIGGNANYHFVAWIGMRSDNPGFFVVNSTGVHSAGASQAVVTLPFKGTVSATVFVAWNPQRGATFRSTGFATNVNFSDIPVVHRGNDAHSWVFIGETGELDEFAAIDDIVIDAPCGECQRDGKVCIWNAGGQFTCSISTPAPTLKPSPAATPAVPTTTASMCPIGTPCVSTSASSCVNDSSATTFGGGVCIIDGQCDLHNVHICNGLDFGTGYYDGQGVFACPDTENSLPCRCFLATNPYPCSASYNGSILTCFDSPRRLVGGACPTHICTLVAPTPATSASPTLVPTPSPVTALPTLAPTTVSNSDDGNETASGGHSSLIDEDAGDVDSKSPTMFDRNTTAGIIAGGVVGALLLLIAVSALAVYMTRKYTHQVRTDAVTTTANNDTAVCATQIDDNGDDSNGEGPVYAPIEEPRQSTMDIPLPSVVRDMYVALPPESSQYANRPPLRTSEHAPQYDALARHEIDGNERV
jgi:hypothetical protein